MSDLLDIPIAKWTSTTTEGLKALGTAQIMATRCCDDLRFPSMAVHAQIPWFGLIQSMLSHSKLTRK